MYFLSVTVAFLLLRASSALALCYMFLVDPSAWLCLVFGLAEIQAVFLGAWNLRVARVRDESAAGVLVPVCYLVGGLMRPAGEPSQLVEVVAALVCLVTIYTRARLGRSFSAGPASLVALRTSGMYGIVRHPLASWHVLAKFWLLLAWPSVVNLALFSACAACAAASVLVEESFLRRAAPAYGRYARQVPWRLVPFVW